VNASKIATARQKALAKHEADSINAATNPIVKEQPVIIETSAQKKVRVAKEAIAKKEAAALARQAYNLKTEEQKRQEVTIAQNKAAESIQRITDSLRTVEQNRLQTEQAAAELQKKNEAALAKQQADDQARAGEQKRQDAIVAQNKEAENIRQMTDSINTIEKKQVTNGTKCFHTF